MLKGKAMQEIMCDLYKLRVQKEAPYCIIVITATVTNVSYSDKSSK
jgi:hypothetical protein